MNVGDPIVSFGLGGIDLRNKAKSFIEESDLQEYETTQCQQMTLF